MSWALRVVRVRFRIIPPMSDGGPCFKSRPFQEFVEKYGIHHVMSSPYHHQSNGQAERAIQEAKKMMEKLGKFHPYHVAFTLNKTERRGNLGAPMDLFLQRPSRSLLPNSQNQFLKIAENEANRKKKAMKTLDQKHRRYNRDQFSDGERVTIQDPITKRWTKEGTIQSSRPTHTGQGSRSYEVLSDESRL